MMVCSLGFVLLAYIGVAWREKSAGERSMVVQMVGWLPGMTVLPIGGREICFRVMIADLGLCILARVATWLFPRYKRDLAPKN